MFEYLIATDACLDGGEEDDDQDNEDDDNDNDQHVQDDGQEQLDDSHHHLIILILIILILLHHHQLHSFTSSQPSTQPHKLLTVHMFNNQYGVNYNCIVISTLKC